MKEVDVFLRALVLGAGVMLVAGLLAGALFDGWAYVAALFAAAVLVGLLLRRHTASP